MAAIAAHNAKRAVEAQVFALQDELEDQGLDACEIDRRCAALRTELLAAPAATPAPPDSAPPERTTPPAPDSAPPERTTPPAPGDVVVLRRLFDATDVAAVLAAGATAARRYPRAVKFEDEGHEDVTGSDAHEVLYLHRDGFFAREYAALCERLTAAMRAALPRAQRLEVRCVELHTYGVGGGLTIPDHRDLGSELSLSALLSDARAFDGGRFVTYDAAGAPVVHELDRGDAVVFASDQVHHVATVSRGERRALVVELWAGPATNHDRSR